jgi:sec-independent protein translocase protein TatA
MISFWQILIVLLIVVIIFGPSRLEKLGPSLGKALRGFKKGLDGDEEKKELADKEADDEKDSSKS